MIILGIFFNFNEKYLRDPTERGYGLFMCRVHEIFSGEFRLKRPYDRCRHTESTPLQRIGDERLKKTLPAVPFEKPNTGVHRQAIFWFWFEYDEFMPFLQSQKNILYPLFVFWTRTQPDR